jgi:hypothetical protein
MLNANPVLDPGSVKRLLMESCSKTGIDVACGGVVNANRAVLAAIDATPVHLSVTRAAGGTIADDTGAVDCGTTCSATLPPGARVVLAATPDTGYAFAGWGDACAASGKSPSCTLTLDRDAGVTAAFARTKVGLTVGKTGRGSVRSTPGGIACGRRCSARFDYGAAVRLEAKPAKGYAVRWRSGCRSRGSACRIKALKTATHVRVAFVPVP